MRVTPRRFACAMMIAALAQTHPLMAKTLRAGKGQTYEQPSTAIASAEPGDIVEIEPGQYYDCAIVTADRLTIIGLGAGATLTDKVCQEKAVLVISGGDVTVRNLTLSRARVQDHNGGGIRAQGINLTVDHLTFVNNETGLLAADMPGSHILITDSVFLHNGRCEDGCVHAIHAGRIGVLHIARSRFQDTQGGSHIVSRAERTELFDNDVVDGPTGTATSLVDLPEAGDLLMQNNRLEKGPLAGSGRVVVIGTERRGEPMATVIVKDNSLTGNTASVRSLVLNWGAASPVVTTNALPEGVAQTSTQGALMHRVRLGMHDVRRTVSSVLDLARRGARKLLTLAS